MAEVVHILDRFVPELERYLQIEDIGCYLIPEGLLSNDEYLVLVRCASKKEAVVELLQKVKRKGPDSFQGFLHALHRSCTENPTPHQGHQHLWDIFQASMSSPHLLKKQKSKSLMSLFKRNKSKKEFNSPLLVSTPHNIAVNSLNRNSNLPATIVKLAPLQWRSTNTLSGSGSDEDYRNSLHVDSVSSSQDSLNPESPLLLSPEISYNSDTPLSPLSPVKCPVDELEKENKELKGDLEKKAKEIEKHKAKIKDQSFCIDELKAENKKFQSKIKLLEIENFRVTELENKMKLLKREMRKVTQENESLKSIVERPLMVPTRGPSSRSQRIQPLGASRSLLTTTSSSLNCINEFEELKCEISEKDANIQSKLDDIVKMCRDMREPSKLKKWHSDVRLVHRQQESDSFYLHSQT